MIYEQQIISQLRKKSIKNFFCASAITLMICLIIIFLGDRADRPMGFEDLLYHPISVSFPIAIIAILMVGLRDYRRSVSLAKKCFKLLLERELKELSYKIRHENNKNGLYSQLIFTDKLLIIDEPFFTWKFIKLSEVSHIKPFEVRYRSAMSYHVRLTVNRKKIVASFPTVQKRNELMANVLMKSEAMSLLSQ